MRRALLDWRQFGDCALVRLAPADDPTTPKTRNDQLQLVEGAIPRSTMRCAAPHHVHSRWSRFFLSKARIAAVRQGGSHDLNAFIHSTPGRRRGRRAGRSRARHEGDSQPNVRDTDPAQGKPRNQGPAGRPRDSILAPARCRNQDASSPGGLRDAGASYWASHDEPRSRTFFIGTACRRVYSAPEARPQPVRNAPQLPGRDAGAAMTAAARASGPGIAVSAPNHWQDYDRQEDLGSDPQHEAPDNGKRGSSRRAVCPHGPASAIPPTRDNQAGQSRARHDAAIQLG